MLYLLVFLVLGVVIGSFLMIAKKRKIINTDMAIKAGDKIVEDILSNPLQPDSKPDGKDKKP